ncbi:MAG: L-seryl-tRNA(Sec) selenium transferase [Caldilineaceae bacterium]|nr:L-seryl-tRNA(Sec) selenium transferase [Caldilineaceae bacterium]
MTTSPPSIDPTLEYRKLPAVDALLHLPQIEDLAATHGGDALIDAVREAVDRARQQIRVGKPAPQLADWLGRVAQILAEREQPTLRLLINATGVIIHTNLGRAPLSLAARRAVEGLTAGYNNLEYDLAAGGRGSRYDHTRALLCELTGAEDALIVNNNASAVYLVLAALCAGRDVIISRGELVEIGGGFRIPDVLRQSGARLVEVGTTNRTHPADFEDAIGSTTAALMRVHASNFRQIGFVTMPSLAQLVEIARRAAEIPNIHPLVIDDLGSGTLLDTTPFGLAAEPTVQQSVAAGADLITFSGDKLLGGPQAGLIVGTRGSVAILRRHPMARALRVDKMTLAALDATLRSYARGRAVEEIPVWRMIAATAERLQARAEHWRQRIAASIPATVIPGESTVGGGSLPGETLPTFLLALDLPRPDLIAAQLRQAEIPVICRIWQDRVVLDPRTVASEEEDHLVNALQKLAAEQ